MPCWKHRASERKKNPHILKTILTVSLAVIVTVVNLGIFLGLLDYDLEIECSHVAVNIYS